MLSRSLMLRFAVVGILLIAATGASAAGSLMNDWIMQNSGPVPRVITNLPEDFIVKYLLPPNIGQARRQKIEYLDLSDVGTSPDSILPYDWKKRYHSLVILDSSRLTADEMSKVELLRKTLFPRETLGPGFNSFWIVQNAGRGAGENFRVLLTAPAEEYVIALIEELSEVNAGELKSGTGEVLQAGHNVSRVEVVTNAVDAMQEVFGLAYSGPFDDLTIRSFSEQTGAPEERPTHEFVCIDWNADLEPTFGAIGDMLPQVVRDRVTGTETDRMGLTSWQAEARRLVAVRDPDAQDLERWYIAGPTKRHVARLAAMVASGLARGETVGIDEPVPADLTDAERLAVGAYLLNDSEYTDQLVVQHKLDDLVRHTLPVAVASGEDLGSVLSEVLGTSAQSPFQAPSGAERIVSATNADYLLLLWAQSLRPEQQFAYTKERLTPALEPFTLSQPSCPGPNDKVLFGGFRYPGATESERRSSEKYRRDLDRYYAENADYERQKRLWEEAQYGREVQYNMRVTAAPTVQLDGYLMLVDLMTREVVWSRDLAILSRGGELHVRDVPVTVRGEETEPPAPSLPPTERSWDESTWPVGRDAVTEALAEGMRYLLGDGLFSEDLRPWNSVSSGFASGQEFRIHHADGTETEARVGQPSLRVLTANQGTVTVDIEQLRLLEPNGDEVRVVLLDATEIVGRPSETAISIVDAGGSRRVDLQSIQSLTSAGAEAASAQSDSGVALTVTLANGATATGQFVGSAIGFDAGILGQQPLAPDQIIEIRQDEGQWVASLQDGSALRGALAPQTITLNVQGASTDYSAEEVVAIRAAEPAKLPAWTLTTTAGTTHTVLLDSDALDFTLASGIHVPVPVANVAVLRRSADGQLTLECTDGNILVGSLSGQEAPMRAADDPGTTLPWEDVALLTPSEASVAEQVTAASTVTAERPMSSYTLKYGQMERRRDMLCIPLRDLCEAIGVAASEISSSTYGGRSVCTFPWQGRSIRVRAGDATVFVNGIGRALTTEAFGTDRLYVPAEVLKVALGIETSVDVTQGTVRVAADDAEIVISSP